jgi:hypothetical protein
MMAILPVRKMTVRGDYYGEESVVCGDHDGVMMAR